LLALEQVILSQLLYDQDYARKTLPYLKEEYFQEVHQKSVFTIVLNHITKYGSLPTHNELLVELEKVELNEANYATAKDFIPTLVEQKAIDRQWLHDSTEKFCQDRALHNAILESIRIIDDPLGKQAAGSIPELLREALSISFDNTVGHDYLEDAEYRYEFYHRLELKIPFHLDYFNKITRGGIVPKTLTVAIAGTGVGKSLLMCDFAAAHLSMGYNVLYITMEMAEEKIAERIDANLIDVPINELENVSKEDFLRKVGRVKDRTKGKLLIKEYPNGSANASHFRYLLNELRLKKQFKPDIIYIDYLNICSSSRLKRANASSYEYIKSIAEELRGLGQEFNLPVFSATQTNREGSGSSDVDLTDTSESFGLPMTVDLMFALMQPEEFEEKGQFLCKQLKNRYSDPSQNRRFVVGVDKSRMRLYDVEDSAQQNIMDGPVFDNTPSGERASKKDFSAWS
jgi:replicative DNA helicase